MRTWPYQRLLRDDLDGRFNYPDGFVSEDKRWLHFAFDHNRDKAIYVGARLPETPALWDERRTLPKAADLPAIEDAAFSVIKPYEFEEGRPLRPIGQIRRRDRRASRLPDFGFSSTLILP
ncbi:MAG: hypothetical protein WD342_05770 [Verrucomicrobiales bacterium]